MHAPLSYDQSPPLSIPLRFFITAAIFGLLASALLLWSGPALLASRWTPQALGLTHLITLGFMLQVMLGALMQMLPVVAGANLSLTRRLAGGIHASLTLGTVALAAAFLTSWPALFASASLLLGAGLLVFMAATARALWGLGAGQATTAGIKLALAGLGVTLTLGLWLALGRSGVLDAPAITLTTLHLGWGLLGWAGVLVTVVAYVVVPMFQITPPFAPVFTRWAAPATITLLTLWTLAALSGETSVARVLQYTVVLGAAVLAATILRVSQRSKRAQRDTTQQYWQLAMLSLLLACAGELLGAAWPALAHWPAWALLWGVLVLYGAMVSVITGMLYKIVPFLVWLHLREQGQGKVPAPNMKLILPEAAMRTQLGLHLAALALLMLACVWPQWLSYPAGLALMAAQGTLLRNLLKALTLYRQHQRRIADSPPKTRPA